MTTTLRHTTRDLTIRAAVSTRTRIQETRDNWRDDRGEISSNLVWVAGGILAAVMVIGIVYTKLSDGANNIDVSPGVE